MAPATFTSSDVDALWAGTLTNVSMNPAAGVGIDTTAGNFTYTTSQSTRGLTKLGPNKLTLTGTYSYPGNTTVSAGTLSIRSAYLANNSTVTIASGAVLDLDTTGASDTIATLVLGGVTVDPGTYNASTPIYGSYFTGSGSLVVVGGSSAAYASWASGLTDPAFDVDSDQNGIPNGLQWILGGTTSEPNPSAILPTLTGSPASGLTLVFSRNSASVAESTLMVEWGSVLNPFTHTLVIGTTDVGPSGDNPTIDIDAPDTGQVTVNIPAANAPDGKLFARLKATQP